MGHIGVKGLHSATDGAPFDNSDHPPCDVCARANIRRTPFPKLSTHRASRLLQRIHCDICGPLPPSYGNFQYYILFVDCYSRFISLFLMKNRSEALSLFIQFKTTAEKFTGESIQLLRVDNAPELIQGQMQTYCKTQGITYEKTVPDAPPQNGVAERTNLTICSMARAMLIDANLRDYFWPFAVLTAAHIKQRVPHSSLPTNVTPFQLWFQHRPNLSHLRPFGAKCTTRIITNHQSKFEPRGEPGRFLGYAKDSKGYLIWVTNQDNNGGTLKVRRDVVFHDPPTQTTSPNILPDYLPLWEGIDFPDRLQPETQGHSPPFMSDPVKTNLQRSVDPPNCQKSVDHTNPHRFNNHTNPQNPIDSKFPNPPRSSDREPSRHSPSNTSDRTQTNIQIRPRRNTQLPSKYSDFVPSNIIVDQLLALDEEELTIPLPNGPSSVHDIVANVVNADLILDNVYINTSNTNTSEEQDPPTVRHAQRSKYWNEWLAAMHEELEALKAKGVYEEVAELPPGRKAVQCKWVLHIKRDQNGQISRFKGRLVAKGFTQIFGQDFTFTFAPVARWDSIRSVLCIATMNDYELRHVDVKNAYLNAPLQEEIYMVAPDGSGSKYWRLHKGLYGLRQAGRQWYLHLHDAYHSLGYMRCESDWSVYVRKSPTALTISATSVDDLLIASDSKQESELAATQIKHKFAITDGGDTEWLLGCRIRRWRNRRLLKIDQETYTTRILHDFNMENCNSVKTPCPSYRLTSDMCPSTDEERTSAAKLPYCAIVGKCMYLSTCTRPDISFAVRELAKYMSNFGTKHYEAAKHLLRYLQGTRTQGIVYGNAPNPYPLFTAFADSDWAMSENRKSISGFLIECANGPLSWSSKQQVVVALSSCEAEYLACSHCARQIIWLRSLFQELGFPQQFPTSLYCDNQGTVSCTHDPQSHSRMKHIDIRAHFIRDSVNKRLIDVHHIPGTENPSDLLTKPLQRVIHNKWFSRIGMDQNP
jgi:hypothetical protein